MQHGVQRIWKKNEDILFTEFIIPREGLTDKRKEKYSSPTSCRSQKVVKRAV